MITPLKFQFSRDDLSKVFQSDLIKHLLTGDNKKSKLLLNQPSGDFFYDPWTIKSEYVRTIAEDLLKSLPGPIGEARFIVLKPGSCYHSHADIDDRYHLNIQGQYSYLIDLDSNTMFETVPDGIWYTMNSSLRHVATNFGSIDRIQLVVRHLLRKNNLKNPIKIKLYYDNNDNTKVRFVFDDQISPWLNRACKQGLLSNFQTDWKLELNICFDIEQDVIEELESVLPEGFKIKTI